MARPRTPVLDRIAKKFEVTDNGCWIWTGALDSSGRPSVRPGGRTAPAAIAYRLLYKLVVEPVADDIELDHLCFTPRCINPDHLEPKSGDENRAAYREAHPHTHCSRGHELTPEATYSNGRCRACQSINASNYRRRRDHGSLL